MPYTLSNNRSSLTSSRGEPAPSLGSVRAGLLNLICAVLMAYLCSPRGGAEGAPQRVPDHVLLVASLLVAPLGWLCMVPPSAYGGRDEQRRGRRGRTCRPRPWRARSRGGAAEGGGPC